MHLHKKFLQRFGNGWPLEGDYREGDDREGDHILRFRDLAAMFVLRRAGSETSIEAAAEWGDDRVSTPLLSWSRSRAFVCPLSHPGGRRIWGDLGGCTTCFLFLFFLRLPDHPKSFRNRSGPHGLLCQCQGARAELGRSRSLPAAAAWLVGSADRVFRTHPTLPSIPPPVATHGCQSSVPE